MLCGAHYVLYIYSSLYICEERLSNSNVVQNDLLCGVRDAPDLKLIQVSCSALSSSIECSNSVVLSCTVEIGSPAHRWPAINWRKGSAVRVLPGEK